MKDTYRTLKKPSAEALFKDRGSKFIGVAFPIEKEEDIKPHILQLKEQHFKARHWCYAWRLGKDASEMKYRANDDGEPKNSAGQPIYGQLLSHDVTNVLVVVVRYFGGTKLGVSGLITAYKTAAKIALENATIVEHTIDERYLLTFEYQYLNKVMQLIKKHQLKIRSQKMESNCEFEISVRRNDATMIESELEKLVWLDLKKV